MNNKLDFGDPIGESTSFISGAEHDEKWLLLNNRPVSRGSVRGLSTLTIEAAREEFYRSLASSPAGLVLTETDTTGVFDVWKS